MKDVQNALIVHGLNVHREAPLAKQKIVGSDTKEKIREVSARTTNQQLLLDSIDNNIITICSGPAGSGRTHCSIGMAVKYLRTKKVDKIVITRPIIGAGEDLAALPGSVFEKAYPYYIPFFDELAYFATQHEIEIWMENKKLEIVPLAICRGRTFKNSFIVCDESQSITLNQMIMILTRLGENSKLCIIGDPLQSDLPKKLRGALEFIIERLVRIEGIAIVELNQLDIIRHPLIGTILKRLEE